MEPDETTAQDAHPPADPAPSPVGEQESVLYNCATDAHEYCAGGRECGCSCHDVEQDEWPERIVSETFSCGPRPAPREVQFEGDGSVRIVADGRSLSAKVPDQHRRMVVAMWADRSDREALIWRVRERLEAMEGSLGAAGDGSQGALHALSMAAVDALAGDVPSKPSADEPLMVGGLVDDIAERVIGKDAWQSMDEKGWERVRRPIREGLALHGVGAVPSGGEPSGKALAEELGQVGDHIEDEAKDLAAGFDLDPETLRGWSDRLRDAAGRVDVQPERPSWAVAKQERDDAYREARLKSEAYSSLCKSLWEAVQDDLGSGVPAEIVDAVKWWRERAVKAEADVERLTVEAESHVMLAQEDYGALHADRETLRRLRASKPVSTDVLRDPPKGLLDAITDRLRRVVASPAEDALDAIADWLELHSPPSLSEREDGEGVGWVEAFNDMTRQRDEARVEVKRLSRQVALDQTLFRERWSAAADVLRDLSPELQAAIAKQAAIPNNPVGIGRAVADHLDAHHSPLSLSERGEDGRLAAIERALEEGADLGTSGLDRLSLAKLILDRLPSPAVGLTVEDAQTVLGATAWKDVDALNAGRALQKKIRDRLAAVSEGPDDNGPPFYTGRGPEPVKVTFGPEFNAAHYRCPCGHEAVVPCDDVNHEAHPWECPECLETRPVRTIGEPPVEWSDGSLDAYGRPTGRTD